MKSAITFLFLSIAVTHVCGFSWENITINSRKINLANNLAEHVLPLKEVITPSIELALSECKKIFKWDRWNCPRSDFFTKHNSKNVDREAAFVRALTTAALIYTITKRCSDKISPDCGCNDKVQKCSDDPEYAEKILDKLLKEVEQSSLDAQGYATLHNSRAGRIAVRNSLESHCSCVQKTCQKPRCWITMKNFSYIALEIRHMYDNALLLKIHNSGTNNWSNIPKNTLAFVHESPNYCLPGSIPKWRGTEGRQCSRSKDKQHSLQERRSCKHLCKECGLRVRTRTVIKYRKCNCTFIWCCEVKCDTCEFSEREHYCE